MLVAGNMMPPPTDAHALILGTWEYVALKSKRDFANGIKVKDGERAPEGGGWSGEGDLAMEEGQCEKVSTPKVALSPGFPNTGSADLRCRRFCARTREWPGKAKGSPS